MIHKYEAFTGLALFDVFVIYKKIHRIKRNTNDTYPSLWSERNCTEIKTKNNKVFSSQL